MKTDQSCIQSKSLSRLVEGRLTEGERTQLEAHLETCEKCQSALDSLIEGDAMVSRVREHLRHSQPVSDKALLDVMDRICSTTFATEPADSLGVDDFAVDYLRPTDNPKALGRLGLYDLIEVIGSGGMGIVFKGRDERLNRVVAVKVLAPAFALNSMARKRFLREAQAAAAVGHPNVVAIHSVDEERLPYLVMEFVDGPSLQERLDSEGHLTLQQILRIGMQVASGLAAAHAQGIVHRDIKPGNIMLESDVDRVKLTDFGLARAADDASMTREGTVVGTPQYMSPEQASGESVDPTSDLFSFGSVLYALATGRPPFRAESSLGVMRKITEQSPTPIRELNPEIPNWLCTVISKLMEKERQSRFQSAEEVHHLLEACLGHAQQPTVNQLPDVLRPGNRSHVFPTFKTLAGVLVMIALATSLMFVLGAPLNTTPEEKPSRATTNEGYEKQFEVAFSNPKEIGTLNVDIKRGSILVQGYDGDKVLVELAVPNYYPSTAKSKDGLTELRANTLDFEIEKSKEQIKLDGNSYEYITNLKIKVPRKTNLILDSYRNGVIEVQDVEGDFRLRSQNNNIRVKRVSGSARLWAYNGNLAGDFVSVERNQTLYFESYNGSIDVWLPEETGANVKYRSGTGSVLTNFDVAAAEDKVQTSEEGAKFDEFVHGSINGGGIPLTLETEKGDIRLRKRMEESVY
ncbi:MAG: protein kinase [Planctomycetota bacterium]